MKPTKTMMVEYFNPNLFKREMLVLTRRIMTKKLNQTDQDNVG